jgi:hypothetical protein
MLLFSFSFRFVSFGFDAHGGVDYSFGNVKVNPLVWLLLNFFYNLQKTLDKSYIYTSFFLKGFFFPLLQKQNKTKQINKQTNKQTNKTKQNKTKQNKTKQNKTKQNKTKQNKTKQNKTKNKQNKQTNKQKKKNYL